MNIVPNNKFEHTIIKKKRMGNKIISEESIKYKDFYFNGNLYSMHLQDEMFTNFVNSYDKKIYKEVEKIFDAIYMKKVPLDKLLMLLENENGSGNERLNRIIQGMGIKKVPSLMKFKPYHDKKDQTLDTVRIYVYYDKSREEFYLYLVDLYHLGIDARNRQGKYDLKNRYEAFCKCNKCISRISDKYIT